MGEAGVEKKRKAVDPGNLLFVVYVGFVMCLILLAIVAEGYADVDAHPEHQQENVLMAEFLEELQNS